MRTAAVERWRVFGSLIQTHRLTHGWTLRGFARMLPTSPSYICYIESGRVPPPSDAIIRRMADVLDIPPIQPSSRHPLLWWGMNSTVFGKYPLDQRPEPHGASSRALNACESTCVNPTGYVGPTRSASFPTEVNNVLTRFVPSPSLLTPAVCRLTP